MASQNRIFTDSFVGAALRGRPMTHVIRTMGRPRSAAPTIVRVAPNVSIWRETNRVEF